MVKLYSNRYRHCRMFSVWVIVLLGMVMLLSQAFTKQGTAMVLTKKADPGFMVIELFTSEGCSSCPAAEEAVAGFFENNKSGVHVLAFHVDYWDRLGWKDRFSKKEYTARQNKYAAIFQLQNIYTPQAVVNGKYEFVGSNRMQLNRTAEKELNNGKGKPIHLSLVAASSKEVRVSYQLEEKTNDLLNVALVQSKAAADVKKGENAGKHLDHLNVVRVFKTLSPAGVKGEVILEIPADIGNEDVAVIAYLQDPASMHISGVEEIKSR